jgi:CRP-like cAMP-binding protein
MQAMTLLRRAPIFASAPAEALQTLAAEAQVRLVDRGKHVLHAGSPLSAIIYLAEGQLLLYRRNKKRGLNVLLGVLDAPSLFGDAEWASGIPWMEDVRAESDCQLVLLPVGIFERFLQKHPRVLFEVYKDACIRHMMANQSLQAMALYDVRTRLLRLLLDFVHQSGRIEDDRGFTGRALRVADLAAGLGVTERTVARALAELKDEGVLDKTDDGQMIIIGVRAAKQSMPENLLGLSSAISAQVIPVGAPVDDVTTPRSSA